MENLETQLAELKAGLETALEKKSAEQISTEIKAFEVKAKGLFADEIKAVKEALELQLKAVQEHADKLDLKLQEQAIEAKNANPKELLVKSITENIAEVKSVSKGKSVKLDLKAVGDMTLTANLNGDQPRDYSQNVVMTPGQLLNVSDLVQVVNISGGTYTFPREVAPGEGSIGAQTEGATKNQKDYDLAMIDANTDFIAGFARYSKKMANNLPFLTSFIPNALRRDYAIAENAAFNAILQAQATASTEIITGQNKIEMLIAEIAKQQDLNYDVNGIVIRPSDYWDILITAKSPESGYGLPGVVTSDNGVLRIMGIAIYKATWLAANKYYVGDWSRVSKIVTEGLSLEFSEVEGTNFVKNNITARIEAQVTLVVEQPAALIYGDFTATA